MLAKPAPWFPGLNRAHPLASGLALYLPLWEHGTRLNDLVAGYYTTPDPGYEWQAGRYGTRLDFNHDDARSPAFTRPIHDNPYAATLMVAYEDLVHDGSIGLVEVNGTGTVNTGASIFGAGTELYIRFKFAGGLKQDALAVTNGTTGVVIGTLDEGYVRLYLSDGRQAAAGPFSGGLNTAVGWPYDRFDVGGIYHPSYCAASPLSAVAMWSRALSASEIDTLFADPFAPIRRPPTITALAGATLPPSDASLHYTARGEPLDFDAPGSPLHYTSPGAD